LAAQIDVTGGSHSISADLIMNGNLRVSTSSGTTLMIHSISDNSTGKSLQLSGGGTLVLTGSASYTGSTIVEAGNLFVTSSHAIADGTSLTVGNPSMFLSAVVPSPTNGASVILASSPANPVPEPATAWLLVAAATTVFALRRSKRSLNGRHKPHLEIGSSGTYTLSGSG
jgi:autotransporter-associated beta strand protein